MEKMPFFSQSPPPTQPTSSFSTRSDLNPSTNLSSSKNVTNPSPSYHDYYDLDTILMEQQTLPVTFKIALPGLGFLEGSQSQGDLREGTTLYLPLWLIESLPTDGTVQHNLPKAYSNSSLKNLRASANSVDLHELYPYFYLFGERLMLMSGDERKIQNLSITLVNALKDRFGWILDYTQTSLEEHTSSFVQGLENTERDILKRGQAIAEMYSRSSVSSSQLKQSSSLMMVEREWGRTGLP